MADALVGSMAMLLLSFGVLVICDQTRQEHAEIYDLSFSEDSAKSFLVARSRVKRRGWFFIPLITGENNKESNERRDESARRDRLHNYCRQNCWGSWTVWTSCSHQCALLGSRVRSRSPVVPSQCGAYRAELLASCSGKRKEQQSCNQQCLNGGTLGPFACACPPGFAGTCCGTAVSCGFPGKPENGDVSSLLSSHSYDVRVKFSCQTGYRLRGPTSRICQDNGEWSHYVPKCEIISCRDPGLLNGGTRTGTDFRFGHSVIYQCDTGYRLSGASILTCEGRGRWSARKPKCDIVTCPRLKAPDGGRMMTNGVTYKSMAYFGCTTGYYLEGSTVRNCLASGRWDGVRPLCKKTICDRVSNPPNGVVTVEGYEHGQVASYSCSIGHQLRGESSRTCGGFGPRGTWSGRQPLCQPISCGDPGTPVHGGKQGSTYTFMGQVTFTCQPGYVLNGAERINCTSGGSWSSPVPVCNACQIGYFKDGVNARPVCLKCPSNSHTLLKGSTTIKQCLCDTGFQGPPGGPCGEVKCSSLSAPEHGTISQCQTTVSDVCEFACRDGFIRTQGDAKRVCRQDGRWTGIQPTCSACPINTFKSSDTACDGCPPFSHTTSIASELQNCVCNSGYSGPAGGPCQDIDECGQDNGGCEQTCENKPGSFKCACTLPGYEINGTRPSSCTVAKECSELTPPANGGLVCHHDRVTNTKRCEVKCNPGFEHIDRTNAFEECGSSTNWLWSHEANEEEIPPCVEQFFPGVEIEAEVAYFVSSCGGLTDSQKAQAKNQMIQLLQSKGICSLNGQSVCNITDVKISCDSSSRRKRDTNPAKLTFKITLEKDKVPKRSVNCDAICTNKGQAADSENCNAICLQEVEHQGVVVLQQTRSQLETLFNVGSTKESSSETSFRTMGSQGPIMALFIDGLQMVPAGGVAVTKQPAIKCGDGMTLSQGMCVHRP
ncbi:sushi, von Willebrand factor type A, EGF and pentraxin domain-containing protein 1 isoform X2 [Lingula anatina]|uniref:Sushi, von Willebrand factor type A, EGF and pentraxin domain-containing protein 1 isoform X2 n=1 Tax=Lingula anatina TaxID=7574 RepID=A0A1S3I8Z2_LINAN|nr:sushi, von Willebrand factor type A, EGF and pentraxin domain-containing protein 1 isoform X2 [Lingula anatina]|eukprot:XP_013394336.1 sushi, von Willebrand factor type A, EGF and pentraxin domain-containing protein 1 isoform X2 [Lingula anatina]